MSNGLKDSLDTASPMLRAALVLLIGFFVFHWIVLARYAIDLPYMDDWLGYAWGDAGSIRPSRLFAPGNDTLMPVGRFFDAVNVRLFAGDNVIYQILTFGIVAGGLLLLQYTLLKRYAPSTTALAVAGISLMLMLQPDTYWGAQSVAYHQALPLLALLGGLWIAVAVSIRPAAKVLFIALIATLGGLAYVSGAFTALAVAAFAALFWWRRGPGPLQAYRASSLGFGLGALISLPAQLWVLLVVQHGATHRPDAPWSTPLAPQFWEFMVGIIGRAIGFGGSASGWTLAASLVLVAVLIGLFLLLLWPLARRADTAGDDAEFAFVFGALSAAVFLFLCMVAAGRASLAAPPESTVLGAFALGQARFYFFWVTILIPWVVLAIMRLVPAASRPWQAGTALGLSVLLLILFVVNGRTIFGLARHYQAMASLKLDGISCLKSKIPDGPPYLCERLFPADLAPALDYAALVGAKFTAYLPAFRPDQAEAAPWRYATIWSTDGNDANQLNTINGRADLVPEGLKIVAKEDSQVLIDLSPAKGALRDCRRLKLHVEVNRSEPSNEPVQMYFIPVGTPDFTEGNSIVQYPTWNKNGGASVDFQAGSLSGFIPRLRFDPASSSGVYVIRAMDVSCATPRGQS